MTMLSVEHLKKTFGDVTAVEDVSFEVKRGQILGLIGQNGSGKTTLFRLILGFLTSEGQGEVLWDGEPYDIELMANQLGYLPEERGLYEKLTIEEQLILFGELRGLSREEVLERMEKWLSRFNVKGQPKDKVETLSKGNQQKVQVIATLLHEPTLLILDEPFSGLDPVNAQLLQEGILTLKEQGSAIIFSSHNMANVEALCDQLVMIHNGQQVLSGTVDEVRRSYGRIKLHIETERWDQQALAELPGVLEVQARGEHEYSLRLASEEVGPRLFHTITGGEYIQQFSQQPPTLEEIFKMKVGELNE